MLFLVSFAAAIIALVVFFNAKKRFNKSESTFAFIGFIVAAVISLMQCFTLIPAGSVGVIDFFGNVSDNTLKSGVNFVNPLANVVKFSIKTQEIKEMMNVPSKEGLSVQLEISLLYHLNPENTFDIYKSVGENYAEIILIPQFRSVVRELLQGMKQKVCTLPNEKDLQRKLNLNLQDL